MSLNRPIADFDKTTILTEKKTKAKTSTKKKTTTLSLDRPIADEKQGMEEAQPHHRIYRREHPGKIP